MTLFFDAIHHLIRHGSLTVVWYVNGFGSDDLAQVTVKADISKEVYTLECDRILKELCFWATKKPSSHFECVLFVIDRLNEPIIQKHLRLINHRGVVFHHASARWHKFDHQKLLELWLVVLPYPLSSPDLAPSDLDL